MNAMSLRRRALMAMMSSSDDSGGMSWYKCDNCLAYHPDGQTCFAELAAETCPNLIGTGAEGPHPIWNLTYEQTGNRYNTSYGICPICNTDGECLSFVQACEVVCGLQWNCDTYLECGHYCEY